MAETNSGTDVGIGLIGCGQWGLNYIRAFGDLEGCRVVAACDLSSERLRSVQRRHPQVRTTTNMSELLKDPAIRAVVVASEASSHHEIVRLVLSADKDCLVEKPLTIDPREARDLRDLANAHNRLLMVGHIFRFNAAVNYVRNFIDSGGVGRLEYLYFTRTNLGPIRSDVNVVWDLMTHDVSILLHFLNQTPSWVSAQGGSFLKRGCDDIAFATLGFEGGVIANIRASWLDPRKVREITLVGSSKMVVLDDISAEPVRIFDKGTIREPSYKTFGEFKLVTRVGDVLMPSLPASEPLRNQCQHFLDCVVERRPVLSDGDDGVRVVEIISAINQSILQNGAPVAVAGLLAQV